MHVQVAIRMDDSLATRVGLLSHADETRLNFERGREKWA